MYAIVEINGQQFKVEEGKKLFVNHIKDAEEGKTVEFDKVLLLDNNGTVTVGAPTINGAKVVPSEDTVPLIMGLKVGKFDAVILDSSIGYGFIKKNPEVEAFFKEVDGSEGFSIAFDKNKQSELIAKINQILDEMKKDGSYDALLKKYELK